MENVFADRALQHYLREISKFKTLSRDEEQELARRAKDGDQDAISRLTQANLKFVVKIASKYQNRGLSLSELISEGNIGLIKAIEKFEPDKDIKLISYAIWWIKQRIMLAVSEKSSLIRVPMGKSSSVHKLKALEDRHLAETGENASIAELSDMMNMGEKSLELLKGNRIETTSFDDILQGGDYQEFSTRDMFEDKDLVDPQKIYQRDRMQEKLYDAIDKLDLREADIIRKYFGLDGSKDSMNFAQIAEQMGLSRERVRQIQKEALKKILHELQPEEGDLVDSFVETYDY